jgi:hypothetical protein
MEEHVEHASDVQKPKRHSFDSRIVRSFANGVIVTVTSLIILGFNLSTAGDIQINDDVNRYFDTCVGEGFIDSTPLIRVDERGFPLAYVQTSHVPVCENTGVELKRNSSTAIDLGALGANILFWTCVTFVLLRRYGRMRTR